MMGKMSYKCENYILKHYLVGIKGSDGLIFYDVFSLLLIIILWRDWVDR